MTTANDTLATLKATLTAARTAYRAAEAERARIGYTDDAFAQATIALCTAERALKRAQRAAR